MEPAQLPLLWFDHVAIAVQRWRDGYRLVETLGLEFENGGYGIGFAPLQVSFKNGPKIEILKPHRADENDFLQRFLKASGQGVHHFTNKVSDLQETIELLRENGYNPIGIDTTNPAWMECFVHPREAHGIVVQFAESHDTGEVDPNDLARAPSGFPEPRVSRAELAYVALAVKDLEAALGFFEGLMGAKRVDPVPLSEIAMSKTADLVFRGPPQRSSGVHTSMRLRLVAPTSNSSGIYTYCGSKPGRFLEFGIYTPAPPTTTETVEHISGADFRLFPQRLEP